MHRTILAAQVAALALIGTGPAQAAPSAGQTYFERNCASCHTVDARLGSRAGPGLYNVVGRKAAAVAGYNYTDALSKAGAAGNPLITHRREDAFTFRPAPGRRYDWLFCDMIENPYRVTELVERWVAEGWCRHFIVNLKFGHHDPVVLAAKLREPGRGLIRNCAVLRIRHLFHDREEITLVGRANS